MKMIVKEDWPLYLIISVVALVVEKEVEKDQSTASQFVPVSEESPRYWIAPSLYSDNSTTGEERKMIIYGQELISNTAYYFGPQGAISISSNGMNCQNCHLEAGARPWANNFSMVSTSYPKYRERSGKIESIAKRVNDCFERSLNGKPIDTLSREMKAMIMYMNWLGKDVVKGEKPVGSGISNLAYLERPADPLKGQLVYNNTCKPCHGVNGEGLERYNKSGYTYPPLWGEHSFNDGAGMYRISTLAGYVKDNMPFHQASHEKPVLTTEEAWDVAAFINSQSRPKGNVKDDWPNITLKPIDYPFGPYADGFNALQHKYGPFKPIIQKRDEIKRMSPRVAINNKLN